MCANSEQAVDMYKKACHSERSGNANLAEIYYLKSWWLFEQAGGSNYLNAANAMNALAFFRWSRKDYEGALRAAKEAMKIMETHGAAYTNADAELIRGTSWDLIDQLCYDMSLIGGMRA